MYENKINKSYLPYLNATQRRQIYYGGAGSGKSVFIAQRVVLDTIKGRNTLALRQVAQRLLLSCHNEIQKAIESFELQKDFTVRQDIISHKNGAQILFLGLDNPEKIKSVSPRKGALTDIWVEEATEIRQESLLQLEKRLRGESPFKKRITLSFNPISKAHWLYRRFFENISPPCPVYESEDLLILKTTYRDNEYLTDDDRRALESEEDEYFKRVYTDGDWGLVSGSVLTGIREERFSENKQLPVRYGLDFGFGKSPSAAIKAYIDKDKKAIYVAEELVMHGFSNEQLAKKLKSFCGDAPIVCDSAEPKSIQELRKMGIKALPAKKGRDSLRFGIRWLNGYTIYVSPDCRSFLAESGAWGYKKDGFGNLTDIPESENKHLCDALRYAMEDFMLERYAWVIV